MKILSIFLLIYLQTLVGGNNKDEFITFFSPSSVFDNKDHNLFVVTKNIQKQTEVGVQFRKANVTVHAQTDGILRVKFNKKKTSGKKLSGDIVYTVLRNDASKANPQCSTHQNTVKYIKQTFYTFIQLDKPVYAPGHTVQFRIIVIDRDLKPYHMNSINVRISDPFNRTIQEFEDLESMYQGIFSTNFTLGEHTPLGDWTLSVVVDKKEDKQVSKIIPVQKYVLPLFTVNVVPVNKYLLDNHALELTISAKYPYGDFVTGNAEVTIKRASDKVVFKTSSYNNIKDTLSVSYHVKNDLKITVTNRTDFEVLVVFTEAASGLSENKTIKFSVFNDKAHKIVVIHPEKFLHDLPYNVRVYPFNWKNESIKEHYEKVTMNFIYTFTNGQGSIETKQFPIVNGVAIFRSVIPNNTQLLVVEAKFIDSKPFRTEIQAGKGYIKAKELVVDYSPPQKNEIDVSVPKIDDKINVHVGSVAEIDELIVVVMTRHGNIQSRREICGFKLSCNFTLEITTDMIPESTVVVYALSDVNQFTYGEVKIKTEQLGKNFLNVLLTVPGQNQKSTVTTKTKTNVIMEFDTEINSKVYLMAFDKRLTFLRKGNEVTRRDVLDEVSIFESKITVDFDDLKSWHDCTKDELQRVKSGRKAISQHTTDFTAADDDGDDDPEDEATDPDDDQSTSQAASEDDLLREYFPESWIFEEFDVKSDMGKKSFKVPDSITSWVVSAFAMHKTFGMAVADSTEITVKNEFFIKIMSPFSVRFKEVLGLNILVYNYAETKETITVSVSLHNKKKEVQFVDYTKIGSTCTPSYSDREVSTVSNVEVPSSGVKKLTIYIRSHPKLDDFQGLYKSILLQVTAQGVTKSKNYVDKVNKRLKVERFGVRQYDLHPQAFRLTKNKIQTWKHIKADTDAQTHEFAKISAVVSVDYLTDVVNLNSRQTYQYWGYLEDYTTKFKANVEYMRYMKARNLTPVDPSFYQLYQWILMDRNRGLHYLQRGYDPNAVIDFRYQAGYSACFLDAIASGMKIKAVTENKNLIQQDFQRLKGFQSSDGSFTNFGRYPERKSGEAVSNKYFETAYVLVSFLKYRDYFDQDYSSLITKAFSFLDSPSNQLNIQPEAKSIAAYAYALNNNIVKAEAHMNDVEKFAVASGAKGSSEKCLKATKSSTACDMRHTAYSILAYHAMDQPLKTKPLVLGMVKTFSLDKSFSHVHAYSIAAEAISTVLSEAKVTEIGLTVNLKNEFNFDHTISISSKNSSGVQEVPFPEFSKYAYISTTGSGWCSVVIVVETMIRSPLSKSYFSLTTTKQQNQNQFIRNKFCIKFIGVATSADTNDNVRFEVEMPSGYMFTEVEDKAKKPFIEDIESRKMETLVMMRFGTITKGKEYCFIVKAKQVFKILKPAAAGVKVYDFTEKDSVTVDFYTVLEQGC